MKGRTGAGVGQQCVCGGGVAVVVLGVGVL